MKVRDRERERERGGIVLCRYQLLIHKAGTQVFFFLPFYFLLRKPVFIRHNTSRKGETDRERIKQPSQKQGNSISCEEREGGGKINNEIKPREEREKREGSSEREEEEGM